MGIGDWINRRRHNRGFGVQSPSAFFFITQVLGEKLPYYAYEELNHKVKAHGGMSLKQAKDLFRITNYMQPSNCIAIASDTAAETMKAARPSVPCHNIEGSGMTEFLKYLKECHTVDMLYIADTPLRNAFVDAVLPHTNNSSIIIVEGIHNDGATLQWWQSVVDNPATIVTYDMYSYGILLFDKEKKKQHYILKR